MLSPALPQRYRPLGLLGEGGSGRVYRVHDGIRARHVALKLVTPAESSFLRREFDTLRQIRHENLIQVFDWGSLESGEAYYTMELIEGEDWGSRMGGPQAADEVRRILTGLLRGLAHLHCHGEIHGDLKPGNVLLGLGGVVKLADVGMGGGGESAAGVSGTPGYAAPEIWQGARADVRSDLYSVGVIAYEALTGRHPFQGRTIREVVSGQLEGWVPSPAAHRVSVPLDIERVVMRALERDRGLRQQSADEFMEGMGVEDRVGMILGGKLIGREDSLSTVHALLLGADPGTPTLACIRGCAGSGRATFLEELVHRMTVHNARVLSLDPKTMLDRLSSVELQGNLGAVAGSEATAYTGNLSVLGEALWRGSRSHPVLLVPNGDQDTPPDLLVLARDLARYLWALSLDRGEPTRVVACVLLPEPGSAPHDFGVNVELPPLGELEFGHSISGLLGTTNFVPQLVQRLHRMTGGEPGLIPAVLLELIEKRLIDRVQGAWRFREIERIDGIRPLGLESTWAAAWARLGAEDREFLAAMALLPARVRVDFLKGPCAPQTYMEAAARACARGWGRIADDGWNFSSESASSAVLDLTPVHRRADLARLLAETLPDGFTREEKAELLLTAGGAAAPVHEGIWAGDVAYQRGDYRMALQRYERTLSVARESGDLDAARTACLRVAEVCHARGLVDSAERVLNDDSVWGASHPAGEEQAQRAILLGLVAKSRGQLDAARRCLGHAVKLATEAQARRQLLRAHAEAAEIDWRHGREGARSTAIERLAMVLRDAGDDPALLEERAALQYGLGSALFLAGRLPESASVLSRSLQEAPPNFFRMRISNALAMTMSRRGDLDAALASLDLAWSIAEKSGFDDFKARLLSNRASVLYRLGRVQDSAEHDLLSASWARRLGNIPEYVAGQSGAAVDLVYMARYDEAIERAREALRAASDIGSNTYVAKSLETEALAQFLVGDIAAAEKLVSRALDFLSGDQEVQVRPRILWLLGKILRARGDLEGAERALHEARRILEASPDAEDELGVQIELHLLRAAEDPGLHADQIRILLRGASRSGNWAGLFPGAVSLSEVLLDFDIGGDEDAEFLSMVLARAEPSGWREVVWRISGALARLNRRAGDLKMWHTRYRHAVRVLQDIAAHLDATHRDVYLKSARVHHLLVEGSRT